MSRYKLSAVNFAFLYVGTLMGAGFASGREIWQFFGVFGPKSFISVLAVTVFFILFGTMTVKISSTLDTTDIGKIVVPFDNKYLKNFFGYVTASILFIAYIVMAAAGGALFQEQFGIHRAFGGAILMLMVVVTILGGFERISKNFKYIIPVLLAIVFFVCLGIIFRDLPSSGIPADRKASPLAPHWYVSAIIYISYNMLGGIPILAASTNRAKSYLTALAGALLGGLLLGLAALIMNLAMMTDEGLASVSVLPVLALSGKLSEEIRWIYAVLLLFSVYSSATSNFYGFTTKIREGRNKKAILISAAVFGFLLSLFGFAEIIAFVFPLEGYFGIALLFAMTIHYIRIMTERTGRSGTQDRFRFPDGIKRVTAGPGGEALLIAGSEKTAIIDCGMAYCGEALADNIKAELGDRPLDYVILSHTHYDHIGGLPYLRRAWPGLISFGAAHGKKVLEKDSALNQIRTMAETAYKLYSKTDREPEVLMEGLKIDRVLYENDIISLGDRVLHIYETPGHTTCSLSFLLEPDGILFSSETTGVYTGKGRMQAGMVKSCRETIESIEKCRKIDAKVIIAPHFGRVPECDRGVYWDLAMESVEGNREFILARVRQGALLQEILEEYTKEFYQDMVSKEQPRDAFLLNAEHMIRNLIKEFKG